MIFRPGNGSPSATNVVLVLVLVNSCLLGLLLVLRFFISQPFVVKLRIHIADNVLQNRARMDFQVKS